MPQFIETEAKIIGPFTLSQFIYIAIGGAIVFVLRYLFTSLFWFLGTSIVVAMISFGFAFYKIDGLSLLDYLGMAFSFSLGPKKYIFRNKDAAAGNDELPEFIKKEAENDDYQ